MEVNKLVFSIILGIVFITIYLVFLILNINEYHKIIKNTNDNLMVAELIFRVFKIQRYNMSNKKIDSNEKLLFFETIVTYIICIMTSLMMLYKGIGTLDISIFVLFLLYILSIVIYELMIIKKSENSLGFFNMGTIIYALINMFFYFVIIIIICEFVKYELYIILLVVGSVLSHFLSKLIIILFDKLWSLIEPILYFESKFKIRSANVISFMYFFALYNIVYSSFNMNYVKHSVGVQIINTILVIFMFILSIDVICRVLLFILHRAEIFESSDLSMEVILYFIGYTILYAIIVNASLNYSLSMYNFDNFINASNDSYDYIEMNKIEVYNSKYDVKPEMDILDELDNNVTIIIEVDSDGKLILDKNVIGKIIKTEKPLGICDSLYYTCISLFTIGYGDITPVSWYAKVESIIMSITSVMLLVVFINLFLNISVEDKTNFISRRNSNYKK